jgi:uncharacterized protein (TIGR00730 family)
MKKISFRVCVYAAASDKIDKKYIQEVERLGFELAEKDYGLVYGAGSTGLMGAIARGMSKGEGDILGVSPHFMHKIEALYDDCDKLVKTSSMAERKNIMENEANAFIIAPGGIGTLDEFFQILTLKKLKRHSKEIILFNFEGFYDSVVALLNEYKEKGFVSEDIFDYFIVANTVEEVIKILDDIDISPAVFKDVEIIE